MICRLWEVELKLTIGAAYSDVIKWEIFGETWSLQGDGKIPDGWVDYIVDHEVNIVCEKQADVSESFLEHFFFRNNYLVWAQMGRQIKKRQLP